METRFKIKQELFNKQILNKKRDSIYLNLGCGKDYLKGFINIDSFGKAYDKYVDLNKSPWPLENNSIDFIFCNHVLEHLKEPELFWTEVHRILKPRSKAMVSVPHKDGRGAYCTFGHRNFFHEDCILSVCSNNNKDSSVNNSFKLLVKEVDHGRIFFWQKREILWVVEKPREEIVNLDASLGETA